MWRPADPAELAKKGIPAIRSGNPKSGGAFAYFDMHKDRKADDILIKLVEA